MIDQILVESAMRNATVSGFDNKQIQDIAILFQFSAFDLIHEYKTSRQFTPIHAALLGVSESDMNFDAFLENHLKSNSLVEIDAPDALERTPLAWAVEHGWPAAVKTLLKHGANAAQCRPCKQGSSPLLHLVIAAPPSPRFESDFLEVIKLLVAAGADINATDADGWTPLHVAASWNLVSAIKVLIVLGEDQLDFDALTCDGETAIDLASLDNGGNCEVIRLLTQRSLSMPADSEWSQRFMDRRVTELPSSTNPECLNLMCKS